MTAQIKPVQNLAEFTGHASLGYLIHILQSVGVAEPERVMRIAEQQAVYLRNGNKPPAALRRLEERWYKSIREDGAPDYSVYAGDDYLAEAWACWMVYSRKHLRETNRLHPNIYSDLPSDATVVDLGNGLGLTTATLKQMLPSCTVVGTNLRGTTQWDIASALAETYCFGMAEDPNDIGSDADLIFASEYFEHFDDPLPHLRHVIESLTPKRLLIANAFTADAIGHFDLYVSPSGLIDGSAMSRMFNDTLKRYGYVKQKTKLWNSRPAYWVLHG